MEIVVVASSSQNPAAVLMQISDSGIGGPFWNNTAGEWQTLPPTADRKIPLTAAGYADFFTGGVAEPIGTYSGKIVILILDQSDNDRVVGVDEAYLTSGNVSSQTLDTGSIATAVRTELNSNPVPASNMVSVAGLATAAALSYTESLLVSQNNSLTSKVDDITSDLAAVDGKVDTANTNIATINGKLPADTATKINRLDTTISSRSTLTASDVRTELVANPVPASNMVSIAGLATAAALTSFQSTVDATLYGIDGVVDAILQDTAALDSRLTAARANYLDNLQAGPVALASQLSTAAALRSKMVAPGSAIIPPSGSAVVRIEIMLFGEDGALNDPDGGTVTFTATNGSGVSRNGNLSAVTKAAVGRYYVDYSIAPTHDQEEIAIRANWTENSVALADATVLSVQFQATTAFTATDRTKLEAIHAKLPSSSYLVGTANASGVIDASTISGDKTAFKADVSTLATSASLAALQTHGDATWATATGFLTAADARLNNLDATISSRAVAADLTNLATSAEVAAVITQGNAAWTTATGFLTAADARLNNLDATISSRSTFAGANVTLASGHGLATAADLASVKAKTDLLPSSPAASSEIPSVAAIAAQVDATLVTQHGAGTWTTGTATAANQTAILSALASIDGVTTIDANIVSPRRTWRIDPTREKPLANNVITLLQAEAVTLAMDFRGMLNASTTLSNVVSAVDVSTDVATISTSNLAIDQTRKKAHFDITATGKGLHRFKITATTTDGQTIAAEGFLEVY